MNIRRLALAGKPELNDDDDDDDMCWDLALQAMVTEPASCSHLVLLLLVSLVNQVLRSQSWLKSARPCLMSASAWLSQYNDPQQLWMQQPSRRRQKQP